MPMHEFPNKQAGSVDGPVSTSSLFAKASGCRCVDSFAYAIPTIANYMGRLTDHLVSPQTTADKEAKVLLWGCGGHRTYGSPYSIP